MRKGKRFVIISDSHGDMQDDETCDAVISFNKYYRPEIRVHAGDAFDFRNLRKGASDEEQADSLEEDWNAGEDFLKRFFDGGAVKRLLRGNHDERIYDLLGCKNGVMRDYAKTGVKRLESIVRRAGAKMLPYDAALGVLKIGRLSVIHGYHAGTNACRQHAAVYGNCVFGHVHTIESAPVASLEPAEARSIGCACIRDMDYMNRRTGKLRWGQGWAYGVVFPNGEYQIFQARKINGSFTVATEIKTLAA